MDTPDPVVPADPPPAAPLEHNPAGVAADTAGATADTPLSDHVADVAPVSPEDEGDSTAESRQAGEVKSATVLPDAADRPEGVDSPVATPARPVTPSTPLDTFTRTTKEQQDYRERQRFIEFEQQSIGLRRLEESHLQLAERLFVAPDGYHDFADPPLHNTDQRLFFVEGVARSGRMRTAHHFAGHLLHHNRAQVVYEYTGQDSALVDIAAHHDLPDGCVVIFGDGFESRPQFFADLDTVHALSMLQMQLKDAHAWFVFVVTPEFSHYRYLEARSRVSTATIAIHAVFIRAVDYYFEHDPASQKRLSATSVRPGWQPADVWDMFYANVDPDDILEALRKDTFETEAAYKWFHHLSNLNYKLFAMLVVLLEGIETTEIDEIYTAAVNELRRQGIEGDQRVVDPRSINTRELYTVLALTERGNTLSFINPAYRAEVKRQIGHYHRLLWTLVSSQEEQAVFTGFAGAVRAMSKQYASLDQAEPTSPAPNRLQQLRTALSLRHQGRLRDLRGVFARAIAQIGIYHRPKLALVLTSLAQHPDAFVAIAPALSLAEIARLGDYDFIFDLLEQWRNSGNFDVMWATVTSITLVYEAIVNESTASGAGSQRQIAQRDNALGRLRSLLEALVKTYREFDETELRTHTQQYREELWGQIRSTVDAAARAQGLDPHTIPPADYQALVAAVLTEAQLTPEKIEQEVASYITLLKKSWTNQLQRSVIQSTAAIVQVRPEDGIGLLRDWLALENREHPLWQTARMVLVHIWKNAAGVEVSQLTRQAYPLLELLPLAMRSNLVKTGAEIAMLQQFVLFLDMVTQQEQLEQAGIFEEQTYLWELQNGNPVDYAVSAIARWYNTAKHGRARAGATPVADEETVAQEELPGVQERLAVWHSHVFPAVLRTINQATRQTRRDLCGWMLRHWLNSEEQTLIDMGHALITRAYVLDGIVLDLPASRRWGAVVVEANVGDDGTQTHWLESVYQFIHQLAATVPLVVNRLGDLTQTYWVGVPQRPVELYRDDLRAYSHHRPPVLVPLLVPLPEDVAGGTRRAEDCHFVVVLGTRPLLDLEDLFTAADLGDWHRKIFLWGHGTTPQLPGTVHRVTGMSLAGLEQRLQQHVIRTLHRLPIETLWQDLEHYDISVSTLRSRDTLTETLQTWVARLDNIETTHPRNDVSLTIAWTILVISRENPGHAVDLVLDLLRESEAASPLRDPSLPSPQQQMGMACARLLFNFYALPDGQPAVAQHGVFLRLLPALSRAAPGYQELIPIFETLISWARSAAWVTHLTADEGELQQSLQHIATQDIRAFLAWLKRYDQLRPGYELFHRVGRPAREFRALVVSVQQRQAQGRQSKPQHRTGLPALPGLPQTVSDELYRWVPEAGDRAASAVMEWVLQYAETHEEAWLAAREHSELIAAFRQREGFVDYLRHRLQLRLFSQFADPGAGQCYGLVFVDSTSKEAVVQAHDFIREYVAHRQPEGNPLRALHIHRLGDKELVAAVKHRVNVKRRDLESRQFQRIPLIGPTLDRYASVDHIGFILVISATEVLDYEEWVHHAEWARRIWVAGVAKWRPVRGNMIRLDTKTAESVDKILTRFPKRNL